MEAVSSGRRNFQNLTADLQRDQLQHSAALNLLTVSHELMPAAAAGDGEDRGGLADVQPSAWENADLSDPWWEAAGGESDGHKQQP